MIQGNDENVSMLKVDELRFFKPFDLQTTYSFDRDDQYVVPVHVFVRETCYLTGCHVRFWFWIILCGDHYFIKTGFLTVYFAH